MEAVLFSMAGDPRGKGRPRATARGGHASTYTDPKTRAYEASVKKIAMAEMAGRQPLEGALSVSMRFRIGLPKSMPKYLRKAYLAGERAYVGGPDVDNMAKSILDGCNAVCFSDDKQVVRLFVTKVAAESAGVDVQIMPLEPQVAA